MCIGNSKTQNLKNHSYIIVQMGLFKKKKYKKIEEAPVVDESISVSPLPEEDPDKELKVMIENLAKLSTITLAKILARLDKKRGE